MRRLITLVIVVDLIGGATLAYALTRPAGHSRRQRARTTAAIVAHPSNPLTETDGQPTSTSETAATTTLTASSYPAHHHRARHERIRVASAPRQLGCSLDVRGARAAVRSETAAGYRVGFALMTASGSTLAADHAREENYGASITKAMLLVAFLRDYAVGGLSTTDTAQLTSMIEVSDNTAADWVYAHLSSPVKDVTQVAEDADMTGFHLNLSDPIYTLGQSLITSDDFARFFAHIDAMMPRRYRRFGMDLLARVQERVGLLDAGLPGIVYSKEGWKPEDTGSLGAPYIVNQAAQFSCRGVTYGIAVTVGDAADQAAGEAVVQRIAGSLMDY